MTYLCQLRISSIKNDLDKKDGIKPSFLLKKNILCQEFKDVKSNKYLLSKVKLL